jgi:hypothetical protein
MSGIEILHILLLNARFSSISLEMLRVAKGRLEF